MELTKFVWKNVLDIIAGFLRAWLSPAVLPFLHDIQCQAVRINGYLVRIFISTFASVLKCENVSTKYCGPIDKKLMKIARIKQTV